MSIVIIFSPTITFRVGGGCITIVATLLGGSVKLFEKLHSNLNLRERCCSIAGKLYQNYIITFEQHCGHTAGTLF